jgi:hypothetical protein
VTAEVGIRLEQRYLVTPVQGVRSDDARHAATDDRDLHGKGEGRAWRTISAKPISGLRAVRITSPKGSQEPIVE